MRRLAAMAVTVCATMAAAETEWEKKLGAFRTQTAAQRAKLGLKNGTKYPTPELSFVAEPGAATNGVIVLCPGQTIEVKLKTNLPAGSLFLATTDDVTISNEKLAGSTWTATLSARPTAMPRPFDVRGVHATSGMEGSLGRFLLGCKHTLVVDVEDARLVAKLDFSSGRRSSEISTEWTKAGKKSGSATYTAALEADSIRLNRRLSAEEEQAFVQSASKSINSPERAAATAKLEAAMKKMEPCMAMPPDKMGACMAPVQAEIAKVNAEMAKLNDAMDVSAAPKFGCKEFELSFGSKNLTGTAKGCPGRKSSDEVTASGTVTTP